MKSYGFLSRPFNYFWLAWVGVFVGKYIDSDEICTVKLTDDTSYEFYLADYYWSKLVCQGFVYESEIDRVLRILAEENFLFLDLGANHGYWSLLASSVEFGSHSVVAIEPVKSNFDRLSANNKLNGNRFTAILSAVTQNGDEQVHIRSNPDSLANEGATIIENSSYSLPSVEAVNTVSVDQLVTQFANSDQGDQGIVIKLDVEGVEVDAIRGAANTLEGETLLIYEDHGNDPESKVTQFVLDLGLEIFHLENGKFGYITGLEEVKSIKTRSNKGYNFFAYRPGSKFSEILKDALDPKKINYL